MSSTALVPIEDAQDLTHDPVQYMAVVLNRAKEWLSEAQHIEEVRESRAVAVSYESYLREKELAFDAQLSATEIVRRCERRIGELVRQGQRDGKLMSRGSNTRVDLVANDNLVTVTEAAGVGHRSSLKPLYDLAEADPQEFEEALAEAKAEGNLSRANVVRKVKGEPAPTSERSEWHRNTRHLDSNRILLTLAQELDALTTGLDLMRPDDLDPALMAEWMPVIDRAISTIRKHVRRITS